MTFLAQRDLSTREDEVHHELQSPVFRAPRTVWLPLMIAAVVAVALVSGTPEAGAQGGSVERVYWTDRNDATVSVTEVQTATTTQLVPSTGGRLQDIDLDPDTGTLYFADWGVTGPLDRNEGAINRVNTDGSGLAMIIGGGVLPDAVHQLALDSANGRLYFTQGVSYTPNQVSRVDYDGSNLTQLRFDLNPFLPNTDGTDSHFPSGLALDAANGLVYWGDIGALADVDGAVNRMDLTGGSPTTLSPHVNGRGRALALDPGSQTIFLTAHDPLNPGSGGSVFAYDIGLGSLTEIIGPDPSTGYWDIEIDPVGQRIWYAAPGTGEIRSALFDGSDVRVELSGLTNPYGLALELASPTGYLELATPVCIESDLVQSDPAAAGLGVGSRFNGTDDTILYEIVTGAPFCAFNCIDGFDINCDGILGDVCPIELNLTRVADVGTCLARFAPPEADSVPAPTVTSTPAAVPISAPAGSGLAHTGVETTLATIGFGLIGAGAAATALSIRRRRN